jgi:hypothetical protein
MTDHAPQSLAYAALDDRLLVTGADREWERTDRLVGADLECVAANDSVPDQVFVGTVESGIQRSTDAGDTFERVGPAIDDRVTALTVSPHDPDVVWAGTEPSAVYVSTDGGKTWSEKPGVSDLPSADEWSFPPRPHTHHVRWITVRPHDPDRLYVAIEAGALVRSSDGGDTWQDRPEDARRDNHTLATHPDAQCRVYTAAGDGYARSEDGGDTWSYPQAGLDHRYVWGLAVSPADPDAVVVSAASGARTAHTPERAEAYVYRRTADGWTTAMDGLPEPDGTVRSLFDTVGETTVYAVNNRGIYRSASMGDRWERLPVEWTEADESQTPRGLAVVDERGT